MSRKALFFVAVCVPEPISGEVRKLQQEAATRFQSYAALRSPPHITLVPPFNAAEDHLDAIVHSIGYVALTQKPYDIALAGFGHFGNRVIFLHVSTTLEMGEQAVLLINALRDISLPLKIEERPFHPHVTIAFKDLSRHLFADAFSYFSGIQFSRQFTALDYTLLKQESGHWYAIHSIRFAVPSV